MKTIALPLFLLSTMAFAQSDNVSIAGKWTLHSSIAGNDSDWNCTFDQKGADLSGTCTSAEAAPKLTGKVDGKKVSWSYPITYEGADYTLTYTGTLDADKIKGEVAVDPAGVTGDFTAAQTK